MSGHDHGGMDHGDMDHGDHGDGGMDHGNMGGMDHSMMMSMTFHTGYQETILFDGWKTEDVGAFVGSVIGIFFLVVLYEAFKYGRDLLLIKEREREIEAAKQQFSESTERICSKPKQRRMLSKQHCIQTVLHGIQFLFSYFLMLIFMVYNVWICMAMVLGAAVGYFFFGNRTTTRSSEDECCH